MLTNIDTPAPNVATRTFGRSRRGVRRPTTVGKVRPTSPRVIVKLVAQIPNQREISQANPWSDCTLVGDGSDGDGSRRVPILVNCGEFGLISYDPFHKASLL